MAYIFFQDVLAALGKRLNFESISNLYGKTVFDKKGGDAISKMIANANPLVKHGGPGNSAQTFLTMPGKTILINENATKEDKQMKDFFGDMDWILSK